MLPGALGEKNPSCILAVVFQLNIHSFTVQIFMQHLLGTYHFSKHQRSISEQNRKFQQSCISGRSRGNGSQAKERVSVETLRLGGASCFRTWGESILPSEEDATLLRSLVGNEGRGIDSRESVLGLLFTSQQVARESQASIMIKSKPSGPLWPRSDFH